MSHEPALHRSLQAGALGAFILGAGTISLLIAGAQSGCGSSGRTGSGAAGNSGTAGSEAGTAGSAGSGTAGSSGGTGGSGGSGACRNDFLEITSDVTSDTTWPCNSYVLKQKVHINAASGIATLTIAPGSTIYGDGSPASPAALISTRNGRLVSVGTPTAPITFTSYAPAGQRVPGDTFAGVVMLGKASINNGSACIGDPNPGTPACEAPGYFQTNIDGIPADDPRGQYGGSDDAWNCGDIRYTRIQFAGYILGQDNELNGLTLGGCGTDTHISYLHVHAGFDDGVEIFGGTVGMDHVVISGVKDDGLDWDFGWRGKVQFLIVQQAYGRGDKGIEADNYAGTETATPRAAPEIWNATLIGQNPNSTRGMHLRAGTWYKLRNFIVYDFDTTNNPVGGALDVESTQISVNNPRDDWPTNISIASSLFFGGALSPTETPAGPPATGACPEKSVNPQDPTSTNNDNCFDEAASLMDPARMNTTTVDPMFAATLNGRVIPSNPSYIPGNAAAVTGKATPPAPFDQTATFAGAVDPATATGSAWYDGWTEFPEN